MIWLRRSLSGLWDFLLSRFYFFYLFFYFNYYYYLEKLATTCSQRDMSE